VAMTLAMSLEAWRAEFWRSRFEQLALVLRTEQSQSPQPQPISPSQDLSDSPLAFDLQAVSMLYNGSLSPFAQAHDLTQTRGVLRYLSSVARGHNTRGEPPRNSRDSLGLPYQSFLTPSLASMRRDVLGSLPGLIESQRRIPTEEAYKIHTEARPTPYHFI
jgi:hypothetical protein